MKIVFTSKGKDLDSMIDPRFGRTDYMLKFDDESKEIEILDNTDNVNFEHGAGPKAVQRLTEFGADILITGNGPGGNAAMVMKKAGIETYFGAGDMTVKEAYEAYKAGKLQKFEY